MTARTAWGFGLATVTDDGTTLDVWYPSPELGSPADDAAAPDVLEAAARVDEARGVRVEVVLTVTDLDAPLTDTADAYLRLHLLSHRLVEPHGQNLEGLFNVLPNVVSPYVVQGTVALSQAILIEASLSYLGLSAQPPTPSWGNMLNEARNLTVLEQQVWQWVPAGVLTVLFVLAVNFVGDGLRDAFDPRATNDR